MLQIVIPATEYWDDAKQEFVRLPKEQKLQLEHSLVSISKWESKWCKPFLSNEAKTPEETIDYIRCMTITQNVNPNVYNFLTNENMEQVKQYIEAPMTATWFPKEASKKNNGEQVTNEIIYYWMTALNIPDKWEKRHLNRLLTLIRVCNAKNQPSKKMSRRDVMNQNRALNAARRKRLNSKG
jgi:hypothetical protein